MRLSTSTGFILLTACGLWFGGLSGADDAKPPPVSDDAKLLEGEWNVVALEADGKKAPAAELKGMRWSFKNLELQCFDPGEKASDKASVKLDSAKSPKHIDLIVLEGPQKGKASQGIFKFEKDRLIVCLGDPESAKKGRPKEFKTEADSGLGMITLERIKK